MKLPPVRRLLIPGLIALAAGLIALVVVLDEDDSNKDDADATGSPALNRLPHINRCVRPADTQGEDDEGLELETISRRVEELRSLSFVTPPEVELVSIEGIDDRIKRQFESDYTAQMEEIDRRLIVALGIAPAGTDVGELLAEGLRGQVAGFYDPEDETLFVASEDDPGLIERITVAHELTHALTDQRLELPPVETDRTRDDAQLAEAALVEGDAVLLEELYLTRHTSSDDLLGALRAVADYDLESISRLPDFIQRSFLFPYVDGAEFVCSLYQRGGWPAVDRAYRELPRSSAEILFPERYGQPAREPRPSSPPGDGWTTELEGEFGAASLLWLLQAPGGDVKRALPAPRGLVSAWGGDQLSLWSRGEQTAMGLAFLERDPDSSALCAAVGGWYTATFPNSKRPQSAPGEELAFSDGAQSAALRCPPGEARLGIAPDLATARRIAAP
ncbi:MAG: hypothetical protein M3M99_05625 [Actinomycetota bacterium]|nr:hypothetical protein [Actinomycetota bacterium]